MTIKSEWRTQTALELCRAMRESQDFSALPILADALQDADCDDAALLARLRSGSQGYAEDAKLVALVMSDETANAVKEVEDFAAAHDGSVYDDHYSRAWSFADFIDAATSYLECGDYITGGTELEGVRVPDSFWGYYQRVTGRNVPPERRGNFFSCSC